MSSSTRTTKTAQPKTLLVSGLGPGSSGVGQVIAQLVEEAHDCVPHVLEFRYPGTSGESAARRLFNQYSFLRPIRQFVRRIRHVWSAWRREGVTGNAVSIDRLILVHPQTLGLEWCERVLGERSGNTWLYLMDSSFFCVRSYNYVPGEDTACLRCIGGGFESARELGCESFPVKASNELRFRERLLQWVQEQRVGLLVQSESHALLARKHFGEHALISVVGLWCADWDLSVGSEMSSAGGSRPHDVVFHGVNHPAKGSHFAFEVARRLSHRTFLFPFAKLDAPSEFASLRNCSFVPMRWESGLKQAVESAPVTLVPSLWSAPVEGALIKSLIHGQVVAIANERSGFAAYECGGLCELLDTGDLGIASSQLDTAIQKSIDLKSGYPQERERWLEAFRDRNTPLIENVLGAVAEHEALVGRGSQDGSYVRVGTRSTQ